MESKGQPLEYATLSPKPAGLGSLLRGFSLLVTAGGIVTAFLGTAGVDDREQIVTGCFIAGFGFTWAILGQILHVIETKR